MKTIFQIVFIAFLGSMSGCRKNTESNGATAQGVMMTEDETSALSLVPVLYTTGHLRVCFDVYEPPNYKEEAVAKYAKAVAKYAKFQNSYSKIFLDSLMKAAEIWGTGLRSHTSKPLRNGIQIVVVPKEKPRFEGELSSCDRKKIDLKLNFFSDGVLKGSQYSEGHDLSLDGLQSVDVLESSGKIVKHRILNEDYSVDVPFLEKVVLHEFGHALGLGDAYDIPGREVGKQPPSVMRGGDGFADGTFTSQPSPDDIATLHMIVDWTVSKKTRSCPDHYFEFKSKDNLPGALVCIPLEANGSGGPLTVLNRTHK